MAVVGDCASEAGVTRLVETAVDELGRVDVFFANAGTDVGRGLDTPDAAWATALEVNVMAHVRAARLLVPRWLEKEGWSHGEAGRSPGSAKDGSSSPRRRRGC